MKNNADTKVIVGMSGGVDSSVAALLLIEQGYQVEGLFMKNWEEDDNKNYCTASEDVKDAKAVCEKLGIKLHTANFAAEYWDNVFEHFLDEYKKGRTPNPDILCNKEIKFKVFLDYAKLLGADFIATGHYAKKSSISNSTNEFLLQKAKDKNKDQSYFLYTLQQEQLKYSIFPLADLEKPEIRKIAKNNNFINSEKKDSTGICFIGERKFKDFLENFIPAQPGKIKTVNGDIIGSHSGLMYYTLGQRQGLNIGGTKNTNNDPWFVVSKDLKNNFLIVDQGKNSPFLYSNKLKLNSFSWVTKSNIDNYKNLICKAKIRYRQDDQDCMLKYNQENDTAIVSFNTAQRAATPGQSIVFYDNENCLGGAIIEEVIHE